MRFTLSIFLALSACEESRAPKAKVSPSPVVIDDSQQDVESLSARRRQLEEDSTIPVESKAPTQVERRRPVVQEPAPLQSIQPLPGNNPSGNQSTSPLGPLQTPPPFSQNPTVLFEDSTSWRLIAVP